ncbi:sulfatase-like hydrolase/transferase [Cellulophaga baltica]|uniref:sulfatase-like hydrolase/transferase n=1 Tax=Cellulophaga baltica TaxID=76594 RepID=UPI0015F448C2|nr:sulfatase-like hydrolase/transferase [Cellulophaga baltica]MBA6316131.1 sulfatase-like hydrolase/transferase [Cellulophaga baltica]
MKISGLFFKFIGLFFILNVSTSCFGQRKKSIPNVLVIYTDDHRYSGIHALGGMEVQTPNMDALAKNGVVFTNTYLMGAFTGATCVASRAMLLTGTNVFQLQGAGHTIPEKNTTIGETFKNVGYNTHIIGKWHQDGASLKRSFTSGDKIMGKGVYLVDHFRMPFYDWDKAGEFKKEDAYLLVYDEQGKIVKAPIPNDAQRGPTGTEKNGPHTSEVFANEAASYFKSYKSKKPFLMYLAFHAPHDPRQAPQAFKDLYDIDNIQLPPSYMVQHPFDNGHMFLRDEQLAPWPRTPLVAKKQLADYYAIITHLDAQIGKVITALKESGQYENTLIVLSGDSGLAVGNHGLMGKQNIYDEDGVHVPLIFSGNLIKNKGARYDGFAYIHDIFPTICDFTNVKAPNTVSGKSLLPIINNEVTAIRDYTYHAYRQFQRAYRKGDYKLIEYVRAKDFSKKDGETEAGSKVTQLFHIKTDPWETQNLSFFPEHRALLTLMRNEMKAKATELGDKKENIEGEKYDFWDFY